MQPPSISSNLNPCSSSATIGGGGVWTGVVVIVVRPARDPVNALLSLRLFNAGTKELTGVCPFGSDLIPSLASAAPAALCRRSRDNPRCALDLMEGEFRPLVADSVAISLINRGGEGLPEDFIPGTRTECFLPTKAEREREEKPFLGRAWFRRLDTEVSHPEFRLQNGVSSYVGSSRPPVGVEVCSRRSIDLSRICHAMSRIRYLVSYDISDRENALVAEGGAILWKSFGVRLQYSVFECPVGR